MADGRIGVRLLTGYDKPEQIERCLNCQKKECNNCVRTGKTAPRGRKIKPVIAFREGEEDMAFDSADDAADFFHVAPGTIRSAAAYGNVCQGYFWRYVCV